MNKVLLIMALMFAQASYAKEKDMRWICVSDDDPKGVYVKYKINSTPIVQRGTESKYAFAKIDDDGDLRFDFNDQSETFIIVLSNRDNRELKKLGMRNVYHGGYYDFSESTAEKSSVKYICASMGIYKH